MKLEAIVLTSEEAAEAIGVNIHTMRRYCREGEIEATTFNKSRSKGFRITVPALIKFIKAKCGPQELISLANWLKIHRVDKDEWADLDAALQAA